MGVLDLLPIALTMSLLGVYVWLGSAARRGGARVTRLPWGRR